MFFGLKSSRACDRCGIRWLVATESAGLGPNREQTNGIAGIPEGASRPGMMDEKYSNDCGAFGRVALDSL